MEKPGVLSISVGRGWGFRFSEDNGLWEWKGRKVTGGKLQRAGACCTARIFHCPVFSLLTFPPEVSGAKAEIQQTQRSLTAFVFLTPSHDGLLSSPKLPQALLSCLITTLTCFFISPRSLRFDFG